MKVFELMAARLRTHGIERIFGVLGDGNMHLIHDFVEEHGGEFVAATQEGRAVNMAAGLASRTAAMAVASTTHGAFSNTLPAMFDAQRGGYPVLLLVGDTAREDRANIQNLPHRAIAAAADIRFEPIESVRDALSVLDRAIYWCATHRRPCVVNIPLDVQHSDVDASGVQEPRVHADLTGAVGAPPDRDLVEEAVGLLYASNRTVILAGRGAQAAATETVLRQIADRLGAVLATTVRGQGLFAGDDFHVGICGTVALPIASEIIAAADSIVAVGASLNPLTGDMGDLLAGKAIVQIDDATDAFGKYFPVDVALRADARAGAQAMLDAIGEAGISRVGFRTEALRHRIATEGPTASRTETVATPSGLMDIRDAIAAVDAIVPADRTVVVDGGRFMTEAFRYATAPEANSYVHPMNVGHIGMSVPYAIGAAFAERTRPVFVVVGDGGLMLGGLAEFTTAVRYQLPLIVLVVNDSAYGAEYYRFRDSGMTTRLTEFSWPEFADVAVALGGHGVALRSAADLVSAQQAIADKKFPLLIDAHIDRDSVPDPGRH